MRIIAVGRLRQACKKFDRMEDAQAMIDTSKYLVKPGETADLKKWKTDDDGGHDKSDAISWTHTAVKKLLAKQEVLYADGRTSLLVIFQAMDTGGKDSTIRRVIGHLNPDGCRVISFKSPTPRELNHDFLWRVHQHVPAKGFITVFNRSHYEDVLIARVKNLVPEDIWSKRFDHINNFEKLLVDEGTVVVKLFLHISKSYQKQRLQRRLDKPDKQWKFFPEDLEERKYWDDYQAAYVDALTRCNTPEAPWYVIPAEKRWFRDALVAQILREKMEAMDLRYPKPDFDPKKIKIE